MHGSSYPIFKVASCTEALRCEQTWHLQGPGRRTESLGCRELRLREKRKEMKFMRDPGTM